MSTEELANEKSSQNTTSYAPKADNLGYSKEDLRTWAENVAMESPFRIVETEQGAIYTLGQHRLTEPTFDYKKMEGIHDQVVYGDWNFQCAVIAAIVQQTLNLQKQAEL